MLETSVLKELRLLPQRLGIASPPRREAAVRAIRRISGALFPLLVIERVCEIDPKAAVVPENAPHLVERLDQMTGRSDSDVVCFRALPSNRLARMVEVPCPAGGSK